MPQYGLTLKSMLETGNAIMPAPGRQKLEHYKFKASVGYQWDPFSKQLQSISQTQARHKTIPFLSECKIYRAVKEAGGRPGLQSWLWASTAPLRRGQPCNSINTWENTKHAELHVIWTKLLFKTTMYFLWGRPSRATEDSSLIPTPMVLPDIQTRMVLPTAEDNVLLSSD